MVSCAASGCKNTSVKGVKMNYFPKDINRRKIWIKNAKLENKTLSSSTALCEFHFTSNMWEKVRVDGTKKLKNTAIPTIFGELVTQQINRKTTINQNTANSTKEFIIITSSTTKSKHITIEPLKNPEKEEDQSKRHPSHTDEIAELSSDGNFIQNNLKEQSKHLTSNTDEIAELNSDGNFLQNVSISECDLNKQILPYVEKIKKLEKLLQKSESLRMTMKKRHKRLQSKYKNKIKELEKKVCINETFPKVIQQFLNEDQIQLLNQKYKKIPKWCNATLVKAYQLKFACGFSGYKELLNQNFPLPSIRTLNRKLENLKFTSGILDEVYQFLNIKISQFSDDRDKDCVLILDEISITPGVIFDTSSFTYIGNVTLPDHDQNEIATHSLVFMLAGVGQRWKQVIAYYYTGNRTHGSVYKQIIINIIKKAEEIGLQVHGVISDMGASNQAMWRAFNIYASRYSTIQNKCIHPCDQNRYLFFFHDCTHAFKNFKEGMLNHEFITISDSFVQKNNLPTNIAQVKHFHDLLSEQKNFPLSLCPKLCKEYLDRSKHFQKMRVKSASHILSHEVSTGLEYLASEKSKPEYKTTSWLVKNVALWFKIVSSRKAIWGISQTKSEKFDEIMNFLNEFISLISSLTFGKKNDWKPFQKGMILSTKSLIELSTYLLNNRNYKYILAGRFTQDCVENLFSVLRMKHCTLNAL